MRECLTKLRESTFNMDKAAESGAAWIGHISSILRAATSCAEAILFGHPILVHCSDGKTIHIFIFSHSSNNKTETYRI